MKAKWIAAAVVLGEPWGPDRRAARYNSVDAKPISCALVAILRRSAIYVIDRKPTGWYNAHYSAHLAKESIMATKVIPITDGRKELLRLAKEAKENLDRFVFTRNGKPEVVLLSIEDYEDLLETLELYEIPGLVETLSQRREDVRAGQSLPESDVFSNA